MITSKFTILLLAAALLSGAADTSAGSAAAAQENGKLIFENNCAKCHGSDGCKGKFGAKNLQSSRLGDIDLYTIISKGKRIMPSWESRLTAPEIRSVITYIKTLRK